MTLKVSVSGVRGIVDQSLTPEICLNFAKAFGTLLNDGHIVVGTDPRASSEFIKGIVIQGLVSTGCKVTDLSICPTPTVALMVQQLKAHGGIVVTASHNPQEWNGLKFLRYDGIFLNQYQGEKLIRIYESKEFLRKDPGHSESFTAAGEEHIKKILKNVNKHSICGKKFKVVLDSVNGAGSFVTPQLLKELGCEVVEIYCKPDGTFPRGAEPTPNNTAKLQQAVKEHGADIGFAQDPDADRLAIVSELGLPVSEEYTLALCVKHVLARSNGKKVVVTNLSTSQAIDDIAKQAGAIMIRTRIGEVHVAEEMKKELAVIGGEGNGGVIFPKVTYNRDSLSGIALILEYMAKKDVPVSEILKELPAYYTDKKKIACSSQAEAESIIERTKEIFRDKSYDLTEGIKVFLKDGWIHVRASNTEPIVRIFAEARDAKLAASLTDHLLVDLKV
ncbi:MAG: phosphoglucosamine mutase [Candidatus Margulisiibacteriota bacterium]|nr:phosphoglucosamine mutase [Candidatus Margulisiibacteriota bacterium]